MAISPPGPPQPGWPGGGCCTWDPVAVAALAGVPALPAATVSPAPPSTATTVNPVVMKRFQDPVRLPVGRLPAGLLENGLPHVPAGLGAGVTSAEPRGSLLAKNSDDIGDQLLVGAIPPLHPVPPSGYRP